MKTGSRRESTEKVRPGRETPVRRTSRPAPAGGPRPSSRPSRDQIVERRRKRRVAAQRQWRLALSVTALLSVIAIFGAAVFHVMVVQSEFRLEKLDAEADAEQQRYERLRLEVARLAAPERIVAAAQQRLGMVPPEEVTYLPAAAPSDDADSRPALGGWSKVKPYLAARP